MLFLTLPSTAPLRPASQILRLAADLDAAQERCEAVAADARLEAARADRAEAADASKARLLAAAQDSNDALEADLRALKVSRRFSGSSPIPLPLPPPLGYVIPPKLWQYLVLTWTCGGGRPWRVAVVMVGMRGRPSLLRPSRRPSRRAHRDNCWSRHGTGSRR